MYAHLFIRSSVNGHGLLSLLITVSNDAMNIGVQTSDQIPTVTPYGCRPRNGSAGHRST